MTAKLTFLTLLLAISLSGHSQRTKSLLYNGKGQLRADTSLKISKDQLSKWKSVEDFFIKDVISKVVYSEMALDNDISGQVLVSFDIDSTKQLKSFKIIKKLGWGIEENIKIFLTSSKHLSFIAPKGKKTFAYFLSFDFKATEALTYSEALTYILRRINQFPFLRK